MQFKQKQAFAIKLFKRQTGKFPHFMKTIFFFICISLCTTYIYAQTNYYAVTKTFNENGYTYQCDVAASKTVTLYNKSNKLLFTTQSYKNTGETFSQTDEGIVLLQYDAWTRVERLSIVNAAFSASEKQRVKGHELIITMCINSDTGKVDEVEFSFMNFGTYATIPISVYRKIETDLKEKVWYIPTEEGKKLNYIYYWWAQEPQ